MLSFVHLRRAILFDFPNLKITVLDMLRHSVEIAHIEPLAAAWALHEMVDLGLGMPSTPRSGSGIDRFLHPHHGRMLRILYLQPVRRRAGTITALPVFRHDALKSELARLAK
jgi:hypothetical protein